MSAEAAAADFGRFSGLKIPAKRAAYSDRTAWLMAIMSELAYAPFDQDGPNELLSLALDLAKLGAENGLHELEDRSVVSDKLRAEIEGFLQDSLDKISKGEDTGNALLRGLLKKGGFDLKGVLFDGKTNTQGFVAVQHPSVSVPGLAVVAFRGTQQKMDWWTNLNAKMDSVFAFGGTRKRIDWWTGLDAREGSAYDRMPTSENQVVGKVHQGFNKAVCSVLPQVKGHLEGHEELPLYVTGHSLGGALATLATWYMPGEKLAACYTFGAPRVGDSTLRDRYRTPIYRVVNGADPVPFVPPSEATVTRIRNFLRFVSIFVFGAFLERMAGLLVNVQGYRHYGDSRYLTICKMQPDETYPGLSVEPAISPMERIIRHLMRWREGACSGGARLDKYHDMSIYRRKLRFWAEKRQNNVI